MTLLHYRKTLAAFALLLVLAATYWLMNARCFQLVGELVCRGDSTRAQVALTFDDAPVPQTTEAVLATLAEKQARGTFLPSARRWRRSRNSRSASSPQGISSPTIPGRIRVFS